MPPVGPNHEDNLEKLSSDGQTPFQPADDIDQPVAVASDDDTALMADDTTILDDTGAIGSTHPQTDTGLQEQEWYDEGLAGAAEAGEPNARSVVSGYEKPEEPKKSGAA